VKRPLRTRGRSCAGKRAHDTETSASEHLDRLVRQGGVRLNAYRCKFCHQWHVGHLPKPRT
jgi:hypothetical protein